MSELVFDIGMHKGDDTAYYLSRGYRVVAVEANPSLCASARERFTQEIAAGQLSVRNVGIAETRGEMDFWVSSETEWSSFHAEDATKGAAQATSIRVNTMSFQQLMEEEGTPFFVKIDIEGNDILCLRDLAATTSRPAYLSFECDVHAGDNIELLESLGYRSFKCIRQNDHREITPRNVVYEEELRRLRMGLEWLPRIGIRRALRRLQYRRRPINGWHFNPGSSGPLGVELPGRWLVSDEVLSVWHQLIAYSLRLSTGRLGEWHDIHAAHESVEG
jgi:FkbM family methyltransferase